MKLYLPVRMRAFWQIFTMALVTAAAQPAAAAGPDAPAVPKKFKLSQADFDRQEIERRNYNHQIEEVINPAGPETADPEVVIHSLGQVGQATFEERARKLPVKAIEEVPALSAPIYTESVPTGAPPLAAAGSIQPAESKEARSMMEPAPAAAITAPSPKFVMTENHFLTPRLKGPLTDAGKENVITSKIRWNFQRKGGGSCANPGSNDSLVKKSAALKEVLQRFTGNDDFYDSQCNQSCPSKQQSTLTSLSVTNIKTTDFDIDQKGIECFYQFRRRPETNWQTLQRGQATCTCLAQ